MFPLLQGRPYLLRPFSGVLMLIRHRGVVRLNQPCSVSKFIITGAVVPECMSQSPADVCLVWLCIEVFSWKLVALSCYVSYYKKKLSTFSLL